MFVPSEFIDWLSGNPDHEAFDWFFSKDDAEAAREYRIGLARQMASGLRITARVQNTPEKSVSVSVRQFPSMVSTVSGRRNGGGYHHFHPDDPEMVSELRRQASQALVSWLSRYRGIAEMSGADVTSVEMIAAKLMDQNDDAA